MEQGKVQSQLNRLRSSTVGSASGSGGRSASQMHREIRSSKQRLEDIRSTTAQESVVVGRFPVNNSGEAYKTIYFSPVVFADRPTITFGFEIDDAQYIKVTRAPVITASVYSWVTIDRGAQQPLYNGAKILVTSTGPALAKFTVIWNASGIAFSNPRS